MVALEGLLDISLGFISTIGACLANRQKLGWDNGLMGCWRNCIYCQTSVEMTCPTPTSLIRKGKTQVKQITVMKALFH